MKLLLARGPYFHAIPHTHTDHAKQNNIDRLAAQEGEKSAQRTHGGQGRCALEEEAALVLVVALRDVVEVLLHRLHRRLRLGVAANTPNKTEEKTVR